MKPLTPWVTVAARLEFKLPDLWVGAFWRTEGKETHLWVCLVPCLPLHLVFSRQEGGAR